VASTHPDHDLNAVARVALRGQLVLGIGQGGTEVDRPKAFSHSENCKIQVADPTVSIEWSEVERGHWRAVCQCGVEDHYEPVADRVRSDSLDAKTSRHAGECEFASETDAAELRVVLKVKEGAGGDYWWVECGGCATAWQVPYYAESVG